MFIVAAKRTAFGTYGGKLKNVTATELGLQASKGALESANISPELINSIIFGNVMVVSRLTWEQGRVALLPTLQRANYIVLT